MPPQQSDSLLDLLGVALDFRPHGDILVNREDMGG
jgi:hypothetical protein